MEPNHSSIWEALLAVQGDAIRIQKNATASVETRGGRNYTYGYVKLDAVHEQVLPVLAKHGLVWLTRPTTLDGRAALGYALRHVPSGDEISDTMLLSISQAAGPQDQGSGITYARRYSLLSVLNLVPGDTDDDAKSAQHPAAAQRPDGAAVKKILDQLTALEAEDPRAPALILGYAGASLKSSEWTVGDLPNIQAKLDEHRSGGIEP
jgi:hypothetical protein